MQLIRTLPIHLEMEDILSWHYDNKGRFLVRSAYKVHRAIVRINHQSCRLGGSKGSEWRGNFLEEIVVD